MHPEDIDHQQSLSDIALPGAMQARVEEMTGRSVSDSPDYSAEKTVEVFGCSACDDWFAPPGMPLYKALTHSMEVNRVLETFAQHRHHHKGGASLIKKVMGESDVQAGGK